MSKPTSLYEYSKQKIKTNQLICSHIHTNPMIYSSSEIEESEPDFIRDMFKIEKDEV